MICVFAFVFNLLSIILAFLYSFITCPFSQSVHQETHIIYIHFIYDNVNGKIFV